LLHAGIDHPVALPLSSAVLAVLPYLLFAAMAYRRRRLVQTVLVLLVPVALPVEFGLLSSMPRGSVTGVALTAAGMLPLFSERRSLIGPCAFLATLGTVANPNAALLLAPALVLLVFKLRHHPPSWLLALGGAIPALLLGYAAKRFYRVHPEHVVHQDWPLDFDPRRISFQAIDELLGQVTPIFWGHGVVLVLILLGLAAWTWSRRQRPVALFLALSTMLLIGSLGVNKVNDGMPTVFYSWSRMFIAAPVLAAMALALVPELLPRWSILPLTGAVAALLVIKVLLLPSVVDREVDPSRATNVHVMRVDDLKARCTMVEHVARSLQADLIVQGWLPTKHQMNYGCPCLIEDFPPTVQPELDRRTWKLRELRPRIIDHVLLDGFEAGAFADRMNGRMRAVEVPSAQDLVSIAGPSMEAGAFLDSLGLGFRELGP
jgi:hypothetical protein